MKEFKLIIAGGRDFNDYELMDTSIQQVLSELHDDLNVSIVSGMAKGADSLAVHWATIHQCVLYRHYAEWDTYGKRAGYVRNEAMANSSSGLLAFHDGVSKSTAHMIAIARAKGLYVKVINY